MFACSEGFEEFLFVKSRVFISKFHVRNIQGMDCWASLYDLRGVAAT